jgi:hypothetical protein
MRAQPAVLSSAPHRGHAVRETRMNGVDYLRTENGDLALLCKRILIEVCGIGSTQEMNLVIEGFSWPLATRRSNWTAHARACARMRARFDEHARARLHVVAYRGERSRNHWTAPAPQAITINSGGYEGGKR